MKLITIFRRITLSLLAVAILVMAGGPALAQAVEFKTVELRDPNVNNIVAARMALPPGWSIMKAEIPWNMNLYADPAHVFYHLKGPADEVEFASFSRLKFHFDQGWLATLDDESNNVINLTNQQCQAGRLSTPAFADMLCNQLKASTQQVLQEFQQQKKALLAGNTVEDGLPAIQPMLAADFAQWLLASNPEVSDVRLQKIERPADIEALLQKSVYEQDAQIRQQSAQIGIPFKGLKFDLARAYYSYSEKGKRYDGITQVIVQYCTYVNNIQLPRLPYQSGPDPRYGKESVWWQAHIFAASALAGKLKAHDADLAIIAANSTIEPLWQGTVDRFSLEMVNKVNQAKREGILERFKSEMKHQQKMQDMRNETFNYVNQRRKEVFAMQSDSLSKAATGWNDAITGRQRWQGSDIKYVAPNQYNFGWEGPDGRTVFSNDSSFNPNTSSSYSGSWTPLQMVPW